MTTEDRMMIMGMCLQGLLANSNWAKAVKADKRMIPNEAAERGEIGAPEEIEETFYRPLTDDELTAQWTALIHEAHRLAALLAPLPEATDAERIARLTKLAYEGLRVADLDGSGRWPALPEVRSEYDQDNLDGVFERVSRWFHDPTGFPETGQDRFIVAMVQTGREFL